MNTFAFFSWFYKGMKNSSPEELDAFVECGVNLPMTPPFRHDDPEDVRLLKAWLDRAQSFGIKMILFADFTSGDLARMGEETWRREFKEFYEVTLERHPAVYGFFVGDEPCGFDRLEQTKRTIVLMTEVLPELKPYINFAGSTGTNFTEEDFGGVTHAEWMCDLAEKSGEFSHTYDQYSQVINNTGGTSEYFCQCLKNVEASEAAGLKPWACLICSAHMAYRPVQYEYGINWQVSTAAACGFKGINWFRLCDTLTNPNYHASPIDAFGNKTHLYYDVLRAQRIFTHHYGEIFMKLKRRGTYFFGEDMNRGSFGRFGEGTHPIIERIKCWEESLVSFFEHEETGEEYFCIVNLSRVNYDHYEIFCDTSKYGVVEVLRNGEQENGVQVGSAGDDWEGHYLYPGQLGLFRIVKK